MLHAKKVGAGPSGEATPASKWHATLRRRLLARAQAAINCLERVDPGMHRRIKGLRLVTAYGLAIALGTLQDVRHSLPANASLASLAGGFALWASVS